MNKTKLFIENFLVYGLGGVISNIIPLIMLPIITYIMPETEYFGINDLFTTVVSFGSALAIMGMYDAMYRLFFDKQEEEYKKMVCSTTLLFTFFVSIVVFIMMILLKNVIAACFFKNTRYAYIVYLSAIATFVGATNGIVSAPTRMQNKKKVFLITNTVSPILSYSVSIPLLLAGYYEFALPLAGIISALSIEIVFWFLNRKWFDPKLFDKRLLKELLVIAVPLIPNFLIYWVFNSCDKVMITNTIGLGAAGVYAVGSKLGHVSQLIYTAFAGGWQFFSFATMKEKDQVKTNSIIFEYLGIISFIATSFICALSYGIFKAFFKTDYLEGYIVAPYLFLAPLLQMLYQVIGNQFLIIKKTWPSSLMLASGAIVNVACNYFMIPILGIEGAALATLIGYFVTVIVCSVTLIKMKLMVISVKFILASLIMLGYLILWRVMFNQFLLIGTSLAIIISMTMIILYRREIGLLLRNIKKGKRQDGK